MPPQPERVPNVPISCLQSLPQRGLNRVAGSQFIEFVRGDVCHFQDQVTEDVTSALFAFSVARSDEAGATLDDTEGPARQQTREGLQPAVHRAPRPPAPQAAGSWLLPAAT